MPSKPNRTVCIKPKTVRSFFLRCGLLETVDKPRFHRPWNRAIGSRFCTVHDGLFTGWRQKCASKKSVPAITPLINSSRHGLSYQLPSIRLSHKILNKYLVINIIRRMIPGYHVYCCTYIPRTRGFVRFIKTVHRRVTAEKQRFRSCPEKKRENRTKPWFCTVYPYGAPWRQNGVVRFSQRRVESHRRKKRSTGNRAEPHRRIYHSTEPHRRIYNIRKPHRTAP